jgi:hypothetical protein
MSEFNKSYYRREGRKVGIFEERVRIIKLLEERKALLEDPNNHYFSLTYIQQLIKGETNG